MSTVIVAAILAAVVGLIIYVQVKNRKAGKHSCGGDCCKCHGCSSDK